jgi:hypothetical protein
MANIIHAPAIDRQHLGRDEAGVRLDQESHRGGNVLRRANPTEHGALAQTPSSTVWIQTERRPFEV